jgi:preprotein translocase subunit SecG
MKNLHKIIALLAFIFIISIISIVFSINTSLNKIETTEEAVEIQKHTLYLLKAEKKTV